MQDFLIETGFNLIKMFEDTRPIRPRAISTCQIIQTRLDTMKVIRCRIILHTALWKPRITRKVKRVSDRTCLVSDISQRCMSSKTSKQ